MAKTFKLEIECDNDAFHPYPDLAIANILRDVAEKITGQYRLSDIRNSAQWVRDNNGNRVGTYKYEDRNALKLGR
jgi:hypothetical protein